jgi:D-alanyl-lipoteichoic acid acyltransferase DltB (MBOAT superfamily)
MLMLQAYGDFSGYSDIAIGVSRLFGIDLMRNFRYPYFAVDLIDYWRRWNISLTTWFRDYVYIPLLGGNRVVLWKKPRNTMIIFLLSGLWHGANWTFIVWGLYHSILMIPLVLERHYCRVKSSPSVIQSVERRIANMGIPVNVITIPRVLLTFTIVMLGRVIYRSVSISDAYSYLCGIFERSLLSIPVMPGIGITRGLFVSTMFFILLLFVVEWFQRDHEHGLVLRVSKSYRYVIYVVLFLSITFFRAMEPVNFIYFQF